MCAFWSVVKEFHTYNIPFNVLVQNMNQYINSMIMYKKFQFQEQYFLISKAKKKRLHKNAKYIDLVNKSFDSGKS